jgi:hypothetical protein
MFTPGVSIDGITSAAGERGVRVALEHFREGRPTIEQAARDRENIVRCLADSNVPAA